MIQDKNPARAAAVLGAAVLAVLGIVACQRESAPPPLAAAGNAAAAAPAPAASPANPHAAEPSSATSAPGTSAGTPAAAGSGPVPGEPVTSELRRAPQSVKVGDAPPSPAPAASGKESELAARERRLAARVAALEAREKQLRQKDQAASASSPQTTLAAPSTSATPSAPSDTALPGDQNAAAADPAAPLDAAAAMSPGPAGPGSAGAGANDGAGSPAAGGGAATGAVEPPPWPSNEGAPRGPATVPAGTSFEVEFTKGLASNTSSVGQTFRARLLSDVRLDGATAIPAGSEILGVVTEAVAARRIGGQAKLSLKITDLVLPSGSTVPIHASFLEEGKSKTGRDAATIGGAAAGGGLLGRILGRSGKGTILGALVGAAVGTAIAARTAGEEVVIPEGSVVKLKLDETLEIKARR